MPRKYVVAAVVIVLVIAAAGLGYYFWPAAEQPAATPAPSVATQAAPQSSGATPQPVIVVIDRAVILQRSKAGQDISRQVQAFADQARKNLSERRRALEDEGDALQKQASALTPDARQKRMAALDAKQHAFQDAVQGEDARIQGALQQANRVLATTMAPILEQVVKEHGADMVLDKRAVIASSDASLDITDEIVKRLDAKLTSVPVSLPPAQAQ